MQFTKNKIEPIICLFLVNCIYLAQCFEPIICLKQQQEQQSFAYIFFSTQL